MATYKEVSKADVENTIRDSNPHDRSCFLHPALSAKHGLRVLKTGEMFCTNLDSCKKEIYKRAIKRFDKNVEFVFYDTAYDIGGREIKGWIALYTLTAISILEFWYILSEEIQNAIKSGEIEY